MAWPKGVSRKEFFQKREENNMTTDETKEQVQPQEAETPQVELSPRQLAERRRRREDRIPLSGMRKKLNAPVHLIPQGEHPHWFVDQAGRLQDCIKAGYEFVDDPTIKAQTGEGPVASPDPMSSHVRVRTGHNQDGTPQYSYLMTIPQEWHDQDRKIVEDHNLKVEESLKRGKIQDQGVRQEEFYVPKEGISITPQRG